MSADRKSWSEAELIAFSRERIERGSKSFAGAAALFSPEVRASAYMLYAWCRHCDDEIDGQELGFNTAKAGAAASAEALERLREKTIAAVEGRAVEPIFLALQTVVAKHAIPAKYPLDLIEGMAMDVRREAYATLQDTLTYAYHVAGCVGVMMAMIMGVRDQATLERACDLGLAFQLTNIARDVAADAGVGRVYLPGDWLSEAGVPVGGVGLLEHASGVHEVTLRLLAEADRYYGSAYYGIARLPGRSALAIAAARRVYGDIGNVVREGAIGRAKVSSARKRWNVVKAVGDVAAAKAVGAVVAAPPRVGLWTIKESSWVCGAHVLGP
jgi:15-cis-phytoene synthase